MNALVLSNLFPSADEPGRGLFNLRGFAALAEFCDVRVVVPVAAWRHLGSPGRWLGARTETHSGLEATYVSYWNLPRVGTTLHARAVRAFVAPYVRRMHAARPFDVVLGVFAYPDLVAAAALADELRLPLVGFVLGSDINELGQWPSIRPQIQRALHRSHSIVSVSHGLKERVVELGVPADKVIVQHNGVEGDVFALRDRASVRAQLSVPPGRKLVCFVGNLLPEKGPDVLLDALTGAPDVHVAFIGSGALKDTLLATATARGVADRISFLGRLPASQVALWLSAADALCLPSRREGCPNVVLEALASGVPVVASRVGGVPELLTETNGMMVPAEDPGALAKALVATLERRWDPIALRASVPSLSWADMGRTLHRAMVEAVAARTGDAAHRNRP
ncbi:MAG: glycosyltransferase [Vicinamibacterales bacterium]